MKIKKEGDISNRGYASAGSFKLISKLGLAFFLSILLLSITANAADVIVESGKLDVGNKLYVDANGNVGIGTTTPTQKLDVAGMMQTTGFKLITAPAAGYVLMSDASGVGTWQLPTSSGSGWTKAGSVVRLTAFTDLVGIGTATPSKKLHVKEAGADTVVAIDSGDIVAGEKYSAVDFYNDGAPKWGIGKNRVGDFYIDKSGAANVITILGLSRNVGINTTNPGSKLTVVGTLNVSGNLTGPGLYVNASGSVGIGTEHPGEKLTVNGTIESTSGGFRFPDGTLQATAGGFGWILEGSNLYASDNNSRIGIGLSSPSEKLTVFNGNISIRNSTDFRLFVDNRTGNVGIGTSNPTARLTVLGMISVSNNRILNVAAPIADSDAATKAYVDAASGLAFAGYTRQTYSGALGGIKGANQKCNATYSESRWATYDDIMRLGVNYNWSDTVWIRDPVQSIANNGANFFLLIKDGTIITANTGLSSINDCSKWTSGTESFRGSVLNTDGTIAYGAICGGSTWDGENWVPNPTFRLACVKE